MKQLRRRFGHAGKQRKLHRIRHIDGQFETLESRQLLAGDLVGHWLAEDLSATLGDGDTVTNWTDSREAVVATAVGTPTWGAYQLGGRAAVHFDPTDGDDALVVSRSDSPASRADDFSIVVAFATDSPDLAGGNGPWFQNTGLVDGSNLGLTTDWGLSINSSGQLSAGLGGGLGGAAATVYSTATGLNDGQLHVATFTRSGSNISLYVDDQPVNSPADADASTRANLGFAIGRLFSQQLPYTGDIAEVRFYDGALDTSEVATITDALQSFYGNSAPVPVDDTYTVAEDTAFFSVRAPGVLANDVDADGDALTAVLVDPPTHGSLALQANGGFFYDSDLNFFGTDTFTYRAVDFRDSEVLGTVTIEVTPAYDAARGVADSYKAVPTQVLTVDAANGVLANDVNTDQLRCGRS